MHYGAILGLQAVGGREVVRTLILPNLKEYGKLLQEAIEQDLPSKVDAETVIAVITKALESLDDGGVLVNGYASGDEEALRQKLHDKLGELIGQRVYDLGRPHLVQAVLEA